MNRQLRFTVTDPGDLGPVSLLLQDWFEEQYGSGQVVVTNPRAEAEQLMDRNSGISYLILFLSLAGLFIASVNVSHILLGRALRMRRNIGILKALGSSRRGIVDLFTAEAVMITLGGALLGILLALPLSRIMTEALEIGSGSILYLILGILLSWILTFAFSVVPALQGARIEAAEAMRRI
jgi:putative ABC transport system permease protein